MDRNESIGLRFDPDLIVYGWTINDIAGSHYLPIATPEEQLAFTRERFRFSRSRSRLLNLVWSRLMLLRFPDLSYVRELRLNYAEDAPAWAGFTRELGRLSTIQAERNLCVAVFLHTHLASLKWRHPMTPIYRRVEAAARERGLFVIGSFDRHAGRDALALSLGPWDPHPNALGHELLAEALWEGVRGLPQRCWDRAARGR